MRSKKIYRLAVFLTEGYVTEEFVKRNPVVSRTIEMRGHQTLEQLHHTIFRAFDRRDDCHLCEFHLGKAPRDRSDNRYVMPFIFDDPEDYDETPASGDIETTRLDDLNLEVGRHFGYWYDFGDDWYHEIEVSAIVEPEPNYRYPRITERIGESPPQYPLDEEDMEDEKRPQWRECVVTPPRSRRKGTRPSEEGN
jgi:hypothetical protein